VDIVAFDIALFSIVLIYIGFYFARKVQKKLWANLTRISSIILSFVAISLAPTMLDMPADSVNKIGMYWLYILISSCLFTVIRRRWKNKKGSSDDS